MVCSDAYDLTVRAEQILVALSAAHARELHQLAPELIQALQRITAPAKVPSAEPSRATNLPGA
jgi:hypothetical protein